MKKLILFFMMISVICANSLVEEEIYYNGDMTEITGKKQYLYDKNKNIVRINILDSNSELQIKLVYSYENGFLTGCDEYNGRTKVKYSKFEYDKNMLIKKTDYNISDMEILVNHYFYNDDKNLASIVKNSSSGDKIGRIVFAYNGDKLIEESQYDQVERLVLTKKYEYKEDRVSRISFFSASGTKVRVIERKYSGPDIDENIFGFSINFLDIR